MHIHYLQKEEARTLDTTILVDKLAEYTTRYMNILAKKITSEEFYHCEKAIAALQAEIKSRNKITA